MSSPGKSEARPIEAKLRETGGTRRPPRMISRRRWLAIRFAATMRWLHIYLSLFGLASVLFFSVTGLTLNHPDWFVEAAGEPSQEEGRVEKAWLGPEVAKLEIVEHLRARHGVRGALVDFRIDDTECSLTFKGPGHDADAFINRETGQYTLTQSQHGLVAILNDLHKGRDSGPAWSLVIDISAVGLTVISLTGLILLAYIKRRRVAGTLAGIVGAAVLLVIAYLLVP